MFGIDSWGDAGAALFGGPLGLAGKKAYDKQQEGNDAQNATMAQAQAQLAQLQKDQQARRQTDLSRALGYFAPADALMARMYGPQASTVPQMRGGTGLAKNVGAAMHPHVGPDRWGFGGAAPPAPAADAMFAAPPPPPPPPNGAGIYPWDPSRPRAPR